MPEGRSQLELAVTGTESAWPGATPGAAGDTPTGRAIRAALDGCRAAWREHRLILALALGYVAAGGAIQASLGRPWPLTWTTSWFAVVWLSLSLPWLAWQWVRHPKRLRACLEPSRLLGAALVFSLAVPVQITFQSLKQSIGPTFGFPWDGPLSRLDQFLHGGAAWYLLARIGRNANAVLVLDLVYMIWFIALVAFITWACWSRNRRLRHQSIVAFLLLWIVGGTILAGVFASAGPCYYHYVLEPNSAYAELMSTVRAHGPLVAARNQDGLWALRQADQWKHFGGISAFPSMHVGFITLLAIIVRRQSRALGLLMWLLVIVTQIGSVVLAWHYAIDGYAGALIAWLCWCWADRLTARRFHV